MNRWRMDYAPHLGIRDPDSPLLGPLLGALPGSTDPLAQIALIRKLGFAGIEDNCLKLRPIAVQEAIGTALGRAGLRMGCVVNHGEAGVPHRWGSGDADELRRIEQDLTLSYAALKRAGGRTLTIISAAEPVMPHGDQLANFIEALKRVADGAAAAGVVLCLESVSWKRMPGLLLHRLSDAARVARAVDHPAVRLVFDVFHVSQMDGDVLTQLDRHWELIEAIQIADVPARTEPGSGELDWVPILREIRGRGYAGLVELEHGLAAPGVEGAEAFLRGLREIDGRLG